MLEFEVNTLQVVSKPVQPRDMSKINLPFWLQDYASQGLWYVGNPNIEIAPSSDKDNVKRTTSWYANYLLCIALTYPNSQWLSIKGCDDFFILSCTFRFTQQQGC
jgi:hypothetical protein